MLALGLFTPIQSAAQEKLEQDSTINIEAEMQRKWESMFVKAKTPAKKSETERIQIVSTHPLVAQFPFKNAVDIDDRFDVYQPDKKYRGEVRVLRPAEKAYSDNGSTVYRVPLYQTSGKKLKPGYVLMNITNKRVEVTLQQLFGSVGGFETRFDYSSGEDTKIPGLFVYAEFGGQLKHYPANPLSAANDYFFPWFGVGLAKGLQLHRLLEIRPFMGFGIEAAIKSDLETYHTLYFRTGTQVAFCIRRNLQLVGGMRFTSYGKAYKDSVDTGYRWNQLFPGRIGYSGSAGIRYCF